MDSPLPAKKEKGEKYKKEKEEKGQKGQDGKDKAAKGKETTKVPLAWAVALGASLGALSPSWPLLTGTEGVQEEERPS